MYYREIPPPPELRPLVVCFWFLRTGPGQIEAIAPDGCMELIVHRAEPFSERGQDRIIRRQDHVLVAGQLDRALQIGPLSPADVVGIRFDPTGAREFLSEPLSSFSNRVTPLSEVCPGLRADLEAAAHEADPVEALTRVLLGRLGQRRSGVRRHMLTDAAVRMLRGTAVSEVAARLGCSERTLERVLLADVGLTPKRLQIVMRFRRFRGLLRRGRSGSEAALRAGYFDHAHASRTFRRLAGVTPTEYLAAQGLTDVLTTDG